MLQTTLQVDDIFMTFVLQLRKLRPREVNPLAQGHTAHRWPGLELGSWSPDPESTAVAAFALIQPLLWPRVTNAQLSGLRQATSLHGLGSGGKMGRGHVSPHPNPPPGDLKQVTLLATDQLHV